MKQEDNIRRPELGRFSSSFHGSAGPFPAPSPGSSQAMRRPVPGNGVRVRLSSSGSPLRAASPALPAVPGTGARRTPLSGSGMMPASDRNGSARGRRSRRTSRPAAAWRRGRPCHGKRRGRGWRSGRSVRRRWRRGSGRRRPAWLPGPERKGVHGVFPAPLPLRSASGGRKTARTRNFARGSCENRTRSVSDPLGSGPFPAIVH